MNLDVSQLRTLGMNSGITVDVQVRSGFVVKRVTTVTMTVHELEDLPPESTDVTSQETVEGSSANEDMESISSRDLEV